MSVEPNAAKGRILSGHDDGFHLMGCKGKITVDSCRWAGLMDDPINIHGTCVRVVKVLSSDKVVCRFMHDMSKGMEWGFPGDKSRYDRKQHHAHGCYCKYTLVQGDRRV